MYSSVRHPAGDRGKINVIPKPLISSNGSNNLTSCEGVPITDIVFNTSLGG